MPPRNKTKYEKETKDYDIHKLKKKLTTCHVYFSDKCGALKI